MHVQGVWLWPVVMWAYNCYNWKSLFEEVWFLLQMYIVEYLRETYSGVINLVSDRKYWEISEEISKEIVKVPLYISPKGTKRKAKYKSIGEFSRIPWHVVVVREKVTIKGNAKAYQGLHQYSTSNLKNQEGRIKQPSLD